MAKISIALQHPFLMTIVPALIGLAGTIYLANKEPASNGLEEAEKVFWQSIQPPNDSEDKYCAYLKKYPNGNFTDIAETQCPAAIEAKEKAEQLAIEQAAAAKAEAEAAEEKAAELAEQQVDAAKAAAEAAEEKAAELAEQKTQAAAAQ